MASSNVVTYEYDILVERRIKALVDSDPVRYAELCDETGAVDDESLYQLGHAELIFQKRKQELLIVGKERTSLGIRQRDLNLLSYPTLERIFYGMHNLVIPLSMLDALNPDEAVAKYLAAGLLKIRNSHLNGSIHREFLGLVSVLDREAYSRMDIRDLRAQSKKKFPDAPGDQRKRLLGLDHEARYKFVDSFFMPYRSSNRENEDNPNSFYDPNIDGHSKRVYVADLARILNGK